MKKQRENSIQNDILELLRGDKKKGIKGIGGWWLNFHGGDPFMPRGLPDIIGCFNGRFVALEVKRPGEAPRKLQGKMLRTLAAAGAITATVYGVDDVRKTLKIKEAENNATKNKHGGVV